MTIYVWKLNIQNDSVGHPMLMRTTQLGGLKQDTNIIRLCVSSCCSPEALATVLVDWEKTKYHLNWCNGNTIHLISLARNNETSGIGGTIQVTEARVLKIITIIFTWLTQRAATICFNFRELCTMHSNYQSGGLINMPARSIDWATLRALSRALNCGHKQTLPSSPHWHTHTDFQAVRGGLGKEERKQRLN